MAKKLRMKAAPGEGEVADDFGEYRFFEIDGQVTAGDIAGGLGCPGMTIAIGDDVLEPDHVFGADDELALFSEPGDVPAFRIVNVQ